MTVVVGGGFGGVLFHEMTGHGLEADAVQKGASVYAGKIGEKVAQPLLTAYDDGGCPASGGRGRSTMRGPRPEDAVIEEGRLTSYSTTASGPAATAESTGNGRRESFRTCRSRG